MKIWILTTGTRYVRQSSVSAYVRKQDALEEACKVQNGSDGAYSLVASGQGTPYQAGDDSYAWQTSDGLHWMTICRVVIGGNHGS